MRTLFLLALLTGPWTGQAESVSLVPPAQRAARIHQRFRRFRFDEPQSTRLVYGLLLAVYVADLEGQLLPYEVADTHVPGSVRATMLKYARLAAAEDLLIVHTDRIDGRKHIQAGPRLHEVVEAELGARLAEELSFHDDLRRPGQPALSLNHASRSFKAAFAEQILEDYHHAWRISWQDEPTDHLKYTYGVLFALYAKKNFRLGMRLTQQSALMQMPSKGIEHMRKLLRDAATEGYLALDGRPPVVKPGPRLEPFVKKELGFDLRRSLKLVNLCQKSLWR